MAYQYTFMGEKITLVPDESLVAVRFDDQLPKSKRVVFSKDASPARGMEIIELPGEKYTIYAVPENTFFRSSGRTDAVSALESADDIVHVVPVFKSGNRKILATDRVLVGVSDEGIIRNYIHDSGCEVLDSREGELLIRIPENESAFVFANAMLGLEGVEYAEPDFVTLGKHIALEARAAQAPDGAGQEIEQIKLAEASRDQLDFRYAADLQQAESLGKFAPEKFVPTRPLASAAAPDPLLTRQYAPKITKAIDAWKTQNADLTIKIAILDEGVDLDHEDLGSNIAGSYDGILNVSPQRLNPWDGHGTACAGLAAAIPNNGVGIHGVGGGCSLLAIRIAQSPGPGKDWVTSNDIITRSIDWAWKQGADILSNSWGGGAPSTAIYRALERARTQGRKGNGVVIVAAAGNDSGPVGFPANLPGVLAVSASNEYDEFKTKTSSDGETWWGSNFGPEISVSAPGVHNLTTDITGSAGYSPGNYTDFNGTSSACPIVAGAAALILSANSGLNEASVRQIIQQTADKVDHYPYSNGRNDQHGFGRLNVLSAIQQAQSNRSGVTP